MLNSVFQKMLTNIVQHTRKVFHAEVLEGLETVEGKSCIWNHATNGGQKSPVKGTKATLLPKHVGGALVNSIVDVFTMNLIGNSGVNLKVRQGNR